MFRYRCPQCGQLLQALEMRAGKTTVCSKCSRPLTIPADRAEWLDEHGEPLQSQDPASAIISGGSSNVLSADAVRRATHLPSFNPLDEHNVHAPIVLGDDDDGVVNLTPPSVVPPTPPPQPLASPPRKVYEATPTPRPHSRPRPDAGRAAGTDSRARGRSAASAGARRLAERHQEARTGLERRPRPTPEAARSGRGDDARSSPFAPRTPRPAGGGPGTPDGSPAARRKLAGQRSRRRVV